MSANSAIEWTDHTFNPWWGCQKVGPGCDHCYAESLDKRTGGEHWGPGAQRRRTSVKNWNDPVRWNKQAYVECMDCRWRGNAKDTKLQDNIPGTEVGSGPMRLCPGCGLPLLKETRQRVFCASMADVFDNAIDPQWRVDLFELIRATPNLDWLLLTKRIGNVGNMLPVPFDFDKHYPNVWIGATIVNQEEADRDIPKLLAVPAAKRFLSMEPLLGPVDLRYIDINGDCEIYPLKGTTECVDGDFEPAPDLPALDWVIVGGESGPGARPMHPDWARDLRDQCEAAGVPFLFKQWGDWMPTKKVGETITLTFPSGGPYGPKQPDFHEWPDGVSVARVGKKAAGRMLDGRTWDGYPS